LEKIEKEENLLRSKYLKAKDALEKERTDERQLERELFTIRGRKTELVTRLELLKVQSERIQEDEEYFKQELYEASHLVGNDISDALQEITPFENENIKYIRQEQEKRRRKVERIKIKLEEIGTGGEDILKEYKEVRERDEFLAMEIIDLEKSAGSLSDLIKELGEKIDIEFKKGIKKINKEFQELFSSMFGGGTASLT